jgi:hypothetical protein
MHISTHFISLTMMALEPTTMLVPKPLLLIVVVISMIIESFPLINLALFAWSLPMANVVDLLDTAIAASPTLALLSAIGQFSCTILRRYLLLLFPRHLS